MFTNNYISSHLSIHSTFALYPTMLVQAPPVIACIWTSSASSFKEHLVKSCGNKFKQMPFTLKDLTKVAFHIEGFHVLPKRYLVHCLEACFRGIGVQSTSFTDNCMKLMVDWLWKWLRTFWGLYKWWHICSGRGWGWTLLSSCATTFWCFMNHSVYWPF
jgi:hypothetical protein